MLAVLLAGSTLGVMGGAILVSVPQVIRGQLGVSGTAAGFILTAHGLAIAVTSPPVGRLVDRFGIRGPMIGGLVVHALGGGAGLVTTSYPALIASRLVFGTGAAAVFTCTTVALLAYYQGAERHSRTRGPPRPPGRGSARSGWCGNDPRWPAGTGCGSSS